VRESITGTGHEDESRVLMFLYYCGGSSQMALGSIEWVRLSDQRTEVN